MSSSSFVRRTVAAVLVAAAAVTSAGTTSAGAAPDATRVVPAAADDLFATPTTDWSALEAAVDRDGSVRVVVQLNVSAKVSHLLSEEQLGRQRAAIANVRGALLSEELGNRGVGGVRTSDEMPLVSMTVDGQALNRLRHSRRVVAVVEDRAVEMALPVTGDGENNGVEGTSSNGTNNQLTAWWDRDRISVPAAQNAGWNGTGQTVAVLDTGVDRNHSWLSGRVVNEACFASTNTLAAGSAGGCPNGTNQQLGLGAAAPCTYAWVCAHGTHVAHTAAGAYGVANASRIMAIQVFHRNAANSPSYYESDLVWGLSHVYNVRGSYRIAAVNMSVGDHRQLTGACDNSPSDTTTTYLAGWINSLKNVGIATVVASGNDYFYGGINRPACIANAVAVGNTTYDASATDAVHNSSNSYSNVDLLAPGTDICSAVPLNLDNDGRADGVGCSWIGTSMAAPHVAGAMAVLRQRRPAATVDQLYSALHYGGVSVNDSRNGVTRSRINVVGALNRI